MSEMKLTLKLSGISDLIKAIRALDSALTRINNKFTNLAQSVNAAATKLSSSVGQIRAAAQAPPKNARGGSTGKGITSGNSSANNFDVGDLISLIRGRNPMLGVLKNIGNMPIGKMLQPISNLFGAKSSSLQTLSGLASKFAAPLLMITAAIAVFAVLIKTFVEVFASIVQNARNQFALFSQGPHNFNQIRGIGKALGMKDEEMANAANDPSNGRIWLNKIRTLRGIKDDEARARAARGMGIDPGTAWRAAHMSNDAWKDANNKSYGDTEKSARGLANWDYALSRAQDEINKFKERFSGIMDAIAGIVRSFANQMKILNDGIDAISKWFNKDKDNKAADKMNNAADKMKDAVDKFSEKTGVQGGGQRANNAIPTAWTYYGNQGNLVRLSDLMGAFEF